MADFYRLTVQYPDGREIQTIHKGPQVHHYIARRFKALGMCGGVGAKLSEEAQTYWRRLDEILFTVTALGWSPQIPEEEADDG